MRTLLSFAVLTMCASAALALLPDGSLRKTAALVIGILLLSIWSDELSDVFPSFGAPQSPNTLLLDVTFQASSSAQEVYTRNTWLAQEDEAP